MIKRKGQVIVEFAIILPLLLFVLFAIIYSGILYHDYITVTNIARASAREAAITGATMAVGSRYGNVESHYASQLDTLMTSFYVKDSDPIVVKQETADSVETTINMKLNVRNYFVDMILPQTFGVRFYMRKEPTS